MGLRDVAGRLLSRLRGAAARNRYASVIEQKIQAEKSRQGEVQARTDRGLDTIRRQRESGERFADLRRDIRMQQQKALEQARAEIGLVPVGEPPLGEDFSGENWNAEWVPVSSSNVDAIRWVGGAWGLQVRFKKQGWVYEYYVPYSTYEDMLAASSKGKFVWSMRHSKVPYHRLTGGIAATRLAYPFGRTTGGKNGRELIRNPNFKRRKLN